MKRRQSKKCSAPNSATAVKSVAITDAEAEQMGCSFNFSAADWKKLDTLVQQIATNRRIIHIGKTVSGRDFSIAIPYRPFDGKRLLRGANAYLSGSSVQHRPDSMRARTYGTIARLAKQLHDAALKTDDAEFFLPGTWQSTDEELRQGFAAMLGELREWARKAKIAHNSLSRKVDHGSLLQRLNPAQTYLRGVLYLWANAGGMFRASRAADGEPSGPTIQYLKLVTRPVMDRHAPGSEALVKLIARERRRREKEKDELGKALH